MYSLAVESFPSFDQFGRDRALKNRDAIEKFMSVDQISSAKVFVENWKKRVK